MPDEQQVSDVLREFARTMVTDFPIQAILDHLVKRIAEIMPVTAAGVTLISPGVHPRYIAASNEAGSRFERLQSELGEGPCLMAYRTGRSVAVPDLRTEERFQNFVLRALNEGLAAVFTFPLRHGDNQLGALDLYRDTVGPLSPAAMTAAQTLADVAAAYLLNAQARSDLQDSADRSWAAALHDPLTGLPNRVLMLERLVHALIRGHRSGKTSAVLFVDLDRFKAVNDTYGHRVGDELLIAVAKRLTGTLREGDTLARFAGDEFVILCEDLDTRSQGELIAARVDVALSRPFVLGGTEVDITGSVGVAFTGHDSDDPEEILHRADLAMYQAKRSAGEYPQPLDLSAQHLVDHQGSLARELRGILGRGELHVAYQPIVATGDGRIIGVEALLRWSHPERGEVSPTVLIPLAERTGMINEIGQWVLGQASADRNRWQPQGQPRGDDLTMSVNVSTYQLMSDGFAGTVADSLSTGGADPRLLTLEMTEGVFVRDPERALLVLNELKELGVKVALDDFGTGYSSLSYLKDFPVDIVKIDRTFITDITRRAASRTIVAAVIGLAHDLGMTVTAEGVETPQQHHALTELGADCCQGFYFARPMDIITFDTLTQRCAGHNRRLPIPNVEPEE
jgi:diguanylate cyclase (GGDEF)-like protein